MWLATQAPEQFDEASTRTVFQEGRTRVVELSSSNQARQRERYRAALYPVWPVQYEDGVYFVQNSKGKISFYLPEKEKRPFLPES